MRTIECLAALSFVLAASPAAADVFFFSTGAPDGKIATLSRPGAPGVLETETADDFFLARDTTITSATFTGLLTGAGAVPGSVTVEIYRIFPLDSDTSRTPLVTTRNNSPSDVAFDSRTSGSGLTFSTTTVAATFMAANSVVNQINKSPNQFTGGEGAVTGAEDAFSVNFTSPFVLPAGHYFFVPQVQVTGGEFLWLSAPDPIVAPGTPFTPDLQAWIRNESLAPDWSRVGTDITHQGPFNMTFSLTGLAVPEPATWAMMLVGLGGVGAMMRRRRASGAIAAA